MYFFHISRCGGKEIVAFDATIKLYLDRLRVSVCERGRVSRHTNIAADRIQVHDGIHSHTQSHACNCISSVSVGFESQW